MLVHGKTITMHDQLNSSKKVLENFAKDWKPLGQYSSNETSLPFSRVKEMIGSNSKALFNNMCKRHDDGTWEISVRTQLLEGTTGEMFDTWLSNVDDTTRYQWWHPIDHCEGTWDPDYLKVKHADRTSTHYFNHTHIVKEAIGKEEQYVKIAFVPPEDEAFFGPTFKELCKIQGISATGCACGLIYVYDFPFGYLHVGHLIHQVYTDKSNGMNSELRSRFWLGSVNASTTHNALTASIINTIGNTRLFRNMKITTKKAQGLYKHASEEMHCLAQFLPVFHQWHIEHEGPSR
jgi:hypothetical protein